MLEMMIASFLKKLNDPGLEIDPEVFQKLVASDGAANDSFGRSVAVSADGLTVVAGAFGDGDRGPYSGSAYIYTKQPNGSYLQTQKLLASDGATEDVFGMSVDITADGLTVVVGASQDGSKATDAGCAYVFTKQSNGTYLQTQKLVASDRAKEDQFGYSLAVSADGSTVVVGAYRDDDKGSNSGSAYIFTRQSNGSYLQTQKLVAADGAAGDNFGYSVAVSGDGSTVISGAKNDGDKGSWSGSAYIFTKQTDGSYLQTQKLLASDGAANGGFGGSVAVSADGLTVVIGATGDGDKGARSGSAYVFTKQTDGSYLETQKLVASDGAASDFFGYSVAVSGGGSTVIASAVGDDDKGSSSGSAYVFTKQTDGSYLETQKLVAADGAASDDFGRSVAVSNTSVVAGASGHLRKGAVYVY